MSIRRRRSLPAAAAVCAAVLVAAGCGGASKGSSKAGGGIGDSGAALVASNALAYVSVDSDLGSSPWQQLDKLLQKFPIRDRLLTELKKALAEKNLDYDRDVKPALGSEVDVAAVAGTGAAGGQTPYILFTKPDSIAKAKELVSKLDSGPPVPATRVVDGWLVVAEKDAMIDAVLKGSGSSLADDAAFKDGFDSLPDDAVAKAYANGPQLTKLLASLPVSSTAAYTAADQPKLDWVAAALVPKDNGLRLSIDIKTPNGSGYAGAAYASKLVSGVPADAIAFLSFHGETARQQLSSISDNPEFQAALAQIQAKLGMSIDRLAALFAQESALYVRHGAGLPEFSLVLDAPDTQRSLATLDELGVRVARLAHGRLGTENQGGLEVKTLTIDRITIRWAGFDGRILITTGPTGIDDYRSGGDKLPDDSAYKDALSAAGAPDKNLGLVYVNVGDAVKLIESYAGLAGAKIPPDVNENLKPLTSFVAYSTQDGDVTRAEAFLEIK